MRDGRRYCLVSPCRDEVEYLSSSIASVVSQSERPIQWVIIDDGSSDGSTEVLREAADLNPWIRVVRREDRGARKVGPGVVDAFYTGLEQLDGLEFDFICKFDVDLDVPSTYFEVLMDKMDADPRLGSASGQAWYTDARTGLLRREDLSFENSAGMTKFYRRRCFEQIGGIVRSVMWDGIDCHRARMIGWRTRAFPDPELRFLHLRPMGSSHKGIWTGRRRHGYGQYFMGTGFAYLVASALRRLFKQPIILGSLAMSWGYVSSALRREPRLNDPPFRSFLRRCQWSMLLRGKRVAIRCIEEAQGTRWKPDEPGLWEVGPTPK